VDTIGAVDADWRIGCRIISLGWLAFTHSAAARETLADLFRDKLLDGRRSPPPLTMPPSA